MIWRGPMLHKAIEQFLGDVYWGDLDFLLCDLPQFSDSIESVLYPESAGRYHRLREQITTTISRYAMGAVVIATIAGTSRLISAVR